MAQRPLSVSITLGFILINSLVWLVFGVIIAVNAHPALPAQPLVKGIMAFLSIAIAGFLLTLFFFIRKHNRLAYFLTLACFIVTSLLSIFDDFGLADLVVLVINLIPILLLLKDRNWYLRVKPQNAGSFSTS